MRLPTRLFIAAIFVAAGSIFFFFVFIFTLLLKHPIPFFLMMFGVQGALLSSAGLCMMWQKKCSSTLLGLGSAWYICFFALTKIHGLVGYAIAGILVLILLDYNRFEAKRKRMSAPVPTTGA